VKDVTPDSVIEGSSATKEVIAKENPPDLT
jgi:hypothetical protein